MWYIDSCFIIPVSLESEDSTSFCFWAHCGHARSFWYVRVLLVTVCLEFGSLLRLICLLNFLWYNVFTSIRYHRAGSLFSRTFLFYLNCFCPVSFAGWESAVFCLYWLPHLYTCLSLRFIWGSLPCLAFFCLSYNCPYLLSTCLPFSCRLMCLLFYWCLYLQCFHVKPSV